jgi:predicted RecA/RadA family phage recombinase
MAQTPALLYQDDDDSIDYTPGSAVTAGDIVVIGGLALFASRDIAASALGSLKNEAFAKVPKKTGAISQGDPIFWNPTADPVTGTAGTGAAQNDSTGLVYPMGFAAADAASGDTYVTVVPDPRSCTLRAKLGTGGAEATASATATLTAAQVLGGFINSVPVAGITLTLPTAALMVAGIPGAKVGDTFTCSIENSSAGANAITLAAGGATLRGGTSIAQNKSAILRGVLTNVGSGTEAYTVHSIVGA